MPNDGIYIEIFAVKNGVRYNAQILNIKDVSLILTNSLMDGIGNIIGVTEEKGNNKSDNIKPCPICGSKSEIAKINSCWGHGLSCDEYFVGCPKCGCRGKGVSDYRKTKEQRITEAIEMWNRRERK